MDLVAVFVRQLFARDQTGLQQTTDESAGAGAGERIEDVDAFRPKRLGELRFEHVIDRMEDKIHHLDRRVHDAKPLGQDREGTLEETVIELVEQFLSTVGCHHVGRAALHTGIELGKAVGFIGQIVLMKLAEHDLHGERDGVCLGELTAFE